MIVIVCVFVFVVVIVAVALFSATIVVIGDGTVCCGSVNPHVPRFLCVFCEGAWWACVGRCAFIWSIRERP